MRWIQLYPADGATGTVAEVAIDLQQSTLQLEPTFISLERQAVVELRNRADINARCCWRLHPEPAADGSDPLFQPVS